jgi:hypothetical protein
MDGLITGENDERIGLSIIDNDDNEHVIEMEFDGEIKHHITDEYAKKAANRTPEQNEKFEQVRRFARYYVYVEEGYDTVPPEIHPERIDAVRIALQNLSRDRFELLFGDLFQQLQSYHDSSVGRAIQLPTEAAGPQSVFYRQHVYLGLSPLETEFGTAAESIASSHEIDLSEAATPLDEIGESALGSWEAFTDQFETLVRQQDADLSNEFDIGGVSSLHTAYIDGAGVEHIETPVEDPFDREPDTLLELAPVDPGPLEEFRAFLDHHLKCQIRDCYVRMGLQPPAEARVLGPGRVEAAEQYKRLDMYPDFTDPDNEQLLAQN